MTPEYRDDVGIVWFWDKDLGVERCPNWTGAHFVSPEEYKRVQYLSTGAWDNGKLGTWIGWGDALLSSPRYEYVVWDGKYKGIQGITAKWLNFYAEKKRG